MAPPLWIKSHIPFFLINYEAAPGNTVALLKAVRPVNNRRSRGEKLFDMTNHLDLRFTLSAMLFSVALHTCISLPHTVRVNSNVKLLGFKHTIASRSIVDPQGSETFYMLCGRMQFCFLSYYCNYYSFINQCLVIWQCVLLADHLRTNSVEKYLRARLQWQTYHLSRR